MEYSAERSIWPSFHAGFRWEISSQSQAQSGFGSNHSDDVVILMTLSHPFFSVKMIMILTQGWYPLVNIQKIWKITIAIAGKIHYFEWAIFKFAKCNSHYQRETWTISDIASDPPRKIWEFIWVSFSSGFPLGKSSIYIYCDFS